MALAERRPGEHHAPRSNHRAPVGEQRVALARALVNRPRLVLADEPTGNLDSEKSDEVLAILRRFNQANGQTCVIVTHDADVAAACDRVIRMRDGKVREPAATPPPVAPPPTPAPGPEPSETPTREPELVGAGRD